MTEEEWRMRFADKLSHMIHNRGCTQSDFAEEAGISAKSINRYVNGIRTPKVTVLMKMAKAFECDPKDLYDFGEKID